MPDRALTEIVRDFLALLPRHKCGLFITHNEHRDYYQTVAQFLEDREPHEDEIIDRAALLAGDELWQFQWYPDTPIGSYTLYAPTLEAIIERVRSGSWE